MNNWGMLFFPLLCVFEWGGKKCAKIGHLVVRRQSARYDHSFTCFVCQKKCGSNFLSVSYYCRNTFILNYASLPRE